jgi:hypothetical protein
LFFARFPKMTDTTKYLALCQLDLATSGRPAPDPMVHLGGSVDVVNFKAHIRTAKTARAMLRDPLGPALSHPMALILSLLGGVCVWHIARLHGSK